MDPSCGKCLGSDCTGFEGYTDPACPEHGTRARTAREAALDREVGALDSRTLRKLVHASEPRRQEKPLYRLQHPTGKEAAKLASEAIRSLSEEMLDLAREGRQRKKLFSVHVGDAGEKLEDSLHETQRLIFEYFRARIHIEFCEVWRDNSNGDYDAWAVW